jgi:hypothetical protein
VPEVSGAARSTPTPTGGPCPREPQHLGELLAGEPQDLSLGADPLSGGPARIVRDVAKETDNPWQVTGCGAEAIPLPVVQGHEVQAPLPGEILLSHPALQAPGPDVVSPDDKCFRVRVDEDVLAILKVNVPDDEESVVWFKRYAKEVLLGRFEQKALYLKIIGPIETLIVRSELISE